MANDIVISRPSFLPAKVDAPAARAAADEFGGGLRAGMPLPMLSTRGKEFRVRMDGNETSLRAVSRNGLDVVLVAARPTVSKRWYEGSYTSGEIVSPTCSSKDGITPDVGNPVSKTCAACPKNAWGSGSRPDGTATKGKACGDYKRVVVWPVGLNSGDRTATPMVLDLAATSLRAPKGSRGLMMLSEYVQALTKNNLPVYAYVATLDFSDAEFPQVTFTPKRPVTEDEYTAVMAFREDDDVQEVLFGEVTEAAGAVKQAEPEAEDEEEVVYASPAKEEKPKAAKPKAAKPAPAPEPEPEVAEPAEEEATEVEDEADMLAEIEALLSGGK